MIDLIKSTSPKGGKRGCLCKDGTYSSECCQGEVSQQGIGSLDGQRIAVVVNEGSPRVVTSSNG